MACTWRISAAILIIGGSALQPIRESALRLTAHERICGKEQTPYQSININYPGVCTVFCVPAGECVLRAQTNKLSYLGITGEGNCYHDGYTERAPLGNLTVATSKLLMTLIGPCKGITLTKFQKPANAEQKMFVDDRICGKEQKPFEAISKMYPGICSVFCVPEGQCEGQAQSGKLNYLGVSGEGNCKRKGYTESAKLGNLTQETVEYLKRLKGPCKGMTLSKFQKPAIAEQKMFVDERICGKEQTPYETFNSMYPGVCMVFCVPDGECEGQAQTGKLKYLGIVGGGNCKGKGYTKSTALGNLTLQTSKWLNTLQGPCKGMTLQKFEKPASN